VPLAPPPPPPPRGVTTAVDLHSSAQQHLDSLKTGGEMRKYLCAMSAKNLPQSDFFPRGATANIYRYRNIDIDIDR